MTLSTYHHLMNIGLDTIDDHLERRARPSVAHFALQMQRKRTADDMSLSMIQPQWNDSALKVERFRVRMSRR